MSDTEVMDKTVSKHSQEDQLRQVLEILKQLPVVNSTPAIKNIQTAQNPTSARSR
jgi:hypothetical protein